MYLYKNVDTGAYRIVGRNLTNREVACSCSFKCYLCCFLCLIVIVKVVINSFLTKATNYHVASPTFHQACMHAISCNPQLSPIAQYRDARHVFGLNFSTPADASSFHAAVSAAVAEIKGEKTGTEVSAPRGSEDLTQSAPRPTSTTAQPPSAPVSVALEKGEEPSAHNSLAKCVMLVRI